MMEEVARVLLFFLILNKAVISQGKFKLKKLKEKCNICTETTTTPCCKIQTVSNADSEDLNGEYILINETSEKKEKVCINGCIYMKVNDPDGDEFCFANQTIEKDPIIDCVVTTGKNFDT